jgi:hypothetical protein
MIRAGSRALLAAALLLLSPARARTQEPPASDPAKAAQAFLGVLRPALRSECVFPVDSEDRTVWSYLPGKRRGLTLKKMNAAERAAAHGMLRASLSAQGYAKTTGVLELEAILRDLETFGGLSRDPELYYLAIFGDPSSARPWGWRFEGHHVSLNFSSADGRIVAATPAFFGAHPARVESGPRAGWRLLPEEEDLARQLLGSLDAAQRKKAIFEVSAPSDIILSPGRKSVPDPAGLAYAEMSDVQRKTLRRLVDAYVGNLRADVAEAQRRKMEKAGLDAVRFGWAGGTRVGEGHYYRIQGPTFVIEYDNTQNGANHVHSVYRDLEDDFGGDLLRRHYAESPHHSDARPREGPG